LRARTIADDVALVLEDLDKMGEAAGRGEDVELDGVGSGAEKGAEELEGEVADIEVLLTEELKEGVQGR
jgi:hypothetical protein